MSVWFVALWDKGIIMVNNKIYLLMCDVVYDAMYGWVWYCSMLYLYLLYVVLFIM